MKDNPNFMQWEVFLAERLRYDYTFRKRIKIKLSQNERRELECM